MDLRFGGLWPMGHLNLAELKSSSGSFALNRISLLI